MFPWDDKRRSRKESLWRNSMAFPFVLDVDQSVQEPKVPRHLSWPSLLGHRDGCLSRLQERVFSSPCSLNRGSGFLTTDWAPELAHQG